MTSTILDPGDSAHNAMELLNERAAIMEYEAGLSRWLAQEAAAKAHGYASWGEATSKLRQRMKDEKAGI